MSWESHRGGVNLPGFWYFGDALVQLPSAHPQRDKEAVPSISIYTQVMVFGRTGWACKVNCCRCSSPSMGARPSSGSLWSAAEQLCPGAAQGWLAARALPARCFLLMQQKAFPSSLYPRNRQDPIRLVMRHNKNMRHKAEAQMLAFMISFIPSVAQGFMSSQNFPQHIFLAVPI